MTMPRQKDLKRLVRARMQQDGRSLHRRPRPRSSQSRASNHEATSAVDTLVASVRAEAKRLRQARRHERRGHQGEDRLHVGALGEVRSTTTAPQEMSHREIATLVQQEIQGRRLVDADRGRRLRAHQGASRARSAARRHVRARPSPARSTFPSQTLFDAWMDASVRESAG